MLIFLLLAAALKSSSSVPLSSTIDSPDPSTPLTIFGRELPECVDPSRRRTLQDIIWSCLVTIFACTWVAVHPNVPEPCTPWWKKLRDRIVTMIYALLAPELITVWALRQRIGAAQHMAFYNRRFHWGKIREKTFGSTLQAIKQSMIDSLGSYDPQCHEHNRKGPWTLTHGFLFEMGGLRTIKGHRRPFDFVKCPSASLSISEAEINDKSKGDFLTKLFVVLQTTWFIFQVFARWITHLPVTELEVVTLGFAFLNIITYVLWWNKPQNMQVPIYIDTGDEDDSEEDWHGRKSNEDINLAGIWRTIFRAPFRLAKFVIMIPINLTETLGTNDDSPFYSSIDGATMEVLIPMTFVSLIFGGLHFIALWASPFPSTAEKILWIISVIWIAAEPALLLITLAFFDRKSGTFMEMVTFVIGLVMLAGGWFYVVARIILMVLAFTTLRDLQPSVYRNIEWTTLIPHF